MISRLTAMQAVYAMAAILIAVAAAMNTHVPLAFIDDPFGIWGTSGPKRIYSNERLSKALLAVRYIPDNFDGVLIGPSLSANLDTRRLTGHRVYNLSINGGNAYELKHAFSRAAAGGKLKFVIICLDPYLVKDTGFKDPAMAANHVEAALLSLTARTAVNNIRLHSLPPAPDVFEGSEAGWNNFDLLKQQEGVDFRNVIAGLDAAKTSPSAQAISYRGLSDLRDILAIARQKKIRVLAYYFPFDIWNFNRAYAANWNEFRQSVDQLFEEGELVWDMNVPEYDYIRRNVSAYSDGHLNQVGANLTLEVVQRMLDRRI